MPITVKNNVYYEIYDNEQGITLPVVSNGNNPKVNNINLSGLNTLINDESGIWNDESKQDFKDLLENEPSFKELITIGEIILSPSQAPDKFYHVKQMTSKNGKVFITVTKCEQHSKFEKVKRNKNEQQKTTVKSNVIKMENKVVPENVVKPKRKRRTKKEMEEFRNNTREQTHAHEQDVRAQVEQVKKEKTHDVKNETSVKKQADKSVKNTASKPEMFLQDFVDRRVSKMKKESLSDDISFEFFMCMKMRDALDEYIRFKYNDQLKLWKKLDKK